MKDDKKVLVIVSLTALVAFGIIFVFLNKKTDNVSVIPTGLTEQPANETFSGRPLTDIKFERTAARLKRGEYLTTGLLQCFTCHSPRSWEDPGAPPIAEKIGSGGTVLIDDSVRRVIAPNITPDKQTGAGTWTDDMLSRAIREGVGHDGRALYWQMPSSTYRNLSDEDLASVIVYLRSIPPVYNVVPPTTIPAEERSEIAKSLMPLTEPVEMPDLSESMDRGRYLTKLGECLGCHTSHAAYNPGLFAGGNHIDRFGQKVFSANITVDPSGMPYGPEGFLFVIRTGKGGLLNPVMPWISFKNMTDEDLQAIYAYMHTFPPAKHSINNQAPFTLCEICGMEHGLGDNNKRETPPGIKLDPDLYNKYAGTYLCEKYNWTVTIVKKENKLIFIPWENGPETELIPQSEQHFLAPGWILPMHFVENKDEYITHLVEETDEGQIYKKIK